MEHIIVKNDALKTQALKALIDEKQKNEQDMAEELLKTFDQDTTFMGYLRALVANAMDDIRWLTVQGGEQGFKDALGDAVNYRWVLEQYGIPGADSATRQQRLEKLTEKWKFFYDFLTESGGANMFSLNASKCADMIRFYGEVIDACSKLKSKDIILKDLKRSLVELGKQILDRSKDYQIQHGFQGGKGPQWTKPKIMTDPGGRGRILGQIGMKDGKVIDDYSYSDLKPPKPSDPDYQEKLKVYNWMKSMVDEFVKRRTATELRIAQMQGGVRLWVHTEVDRTAKIDKVFGLSHGATISGTTTDNVFFFNRFSLVDRYLGEDPTVMDGRLDKFLLKYYSFAGGPKGVRFGERVTRNVPVPRRNQIIDPILYILPLGAIVGEGHHSTIECALPLVLNGIIDYTVGEYETLFPRDRQRRNACGSMGAIKNTLAKYQQKNRDKKIIIYYDANGDYEGYFRFDPVRDQQWGAIAEVSQAMSNKFAGFRQYPTKDNVASLHNSIREALEGLGSQTQKDRFRSARDFWQQRTR